MDKWSPIYLSEGLRGKCLKWANKQTDIYLSYMVVEESVEKLDDFLANFGMCAISHEESFLVYIDKSGLVVINYKIDLAKEDIKEEKGFFYIPPENYKSIEIDADNVITINSDQRTIKTNINEIFSKLPSQHRCTSEKGIAAFLKLNNDKTKPVKKVKSYNSKLGRFTLDPNYDWYKVKTTIGSESATVYVNYEYPDNYPDSLVHNIEQAENFIQKELYKKALEQAATQIVELYNDYWIEDDILLTNDDLKKRIRLDSISINPDSMFDISFSEDYLFGGNDITISSDAEGNQKDIRIE